MPEPSSDPPKAPRFYFEPLGSKHDRGGFSCGVAALDNYLRKQARQDIRKQVSATFVLTHDGKTIAGYYTLSQYSVRLEDVPQEIARRLPKYPEVPATLIGRLAVSSTRRGQGLGEFLLMDALRRCLEISSEIAAAAIIVDAKDDVAKGFYKKYGFIELPTIPTRLFLPMATVRQFFSLEDAATKAANG